MIFIQFFELKFLPKRSFWHKVIWNVTENYEIAEFRTGIFIGVLLNIYLIRLDFKLFSDLKKSKWISEISWKF